MTSHDAYNDDPWNAPADDGGYGDCSTCGDPIDYCLGHGQAGSSDFLLEVDLDDDDYEEPSGPSPEQEREWDLRDDEWRGNALD